MMELFSFIFGLLGACPKPVVPTPVNPTPSPTPAQSAAWEDAHKLKCKAAESRQSDGSYSGPAFRKTVAEMVKTKRRDGEKIRRKEAVDAVSDAFDDANASRIEDIYVEVCEFRHS